jgi:hypothetical protein
MIAREKRAKQLAVCGAWQCTRQSTGQAALQMSQVAAASMVAGVPQFLYVVPGGLGLAGSSRSRSSSQQLRTRCQLGAVGQLAVAATCQQVMRHNLGS